MNRFTAEPQSTQRLVLVNGDTISDFGFRIENPAITNHQAPSTNKVFREIP